MRAFLGFVGFLSLVAGMLVAGTIKSDIQIQIVATCILGAFILFGLSAVLRAIEGLRREVRAATPKPAPEAPQVRREPSF